MTPLFLSLVPPVFVRPFFFPFTSGLFFPTGFFPIFLPTLTTIADPPMQGFADPIALEINHQSTAADDQVADHDVGGSALDAGEGAGSAAAPQTALLIFQDGSIERVSDYWLDDNWHVHYVTTDGGKHSVPLERLNLVKTSETNMQRGGNFALDPDSHRHKK